MIRRFLAVSAMSVLMGASFAAAQMPPAGGDGGGDNGGGAAGGGRQRGGGGANGGGPGGGGPGGGGPAQFQQRMMERMKTELGATEDEWTVLEPKIQKVMDINRDLQAGPMGGMGGRRGGAAAPAAAEGEVAKATAALRETLQNTDATPEEITTKLTALRDARTKATADLEEARKDLKSVVTPRQEAVLVLAGTLQ